MPNCFSCGRHIHNQERTFKRELYSGSSMRTNYGKRISFNSSKHYSMKTVCSDCAHQIDQQRESSNKAIVIIALLIIMGILIIILFS